MESDLYELLVATFNGESGAQDALRQLETLDKKDEGFKIDDAAILFVDQQKKLNIKETGDTRGGKGAAIGAVVGGAIGLIGGPLAIATSALGAAIGGGVASLSDGGFPDEQLKIIGRSLRPGMSALVVLANMTGAIDLDQAIAGFGAQSVKHAPLNKALLVPQDSSSRVRSDFFDMAAGATAVNLMGEIARDENQPPAEADPAN